MPGTTALDVGANLGLYTYWIAKRAGAVHAFEPNPTLASYLHRARLRGVVVHGAAASNTAGAATLRVPEGLGEAHLVEGGLAGEGADLSVRTMTIDSLALSGVSFVKVDVEGHEAQALEGAHDTLRRNRPVVFIELEERHAAGTVERTAAYFLDELGYGTGAFMRWGSFHPISEFDGPEMQPIEHGDRAGSDYVSNFLFTP